MDVVYISALSALAGSIIGGLTSGLTTWMNQRAQVRAARLAYDLSRQEDLFRDFIVAASKAYSEATQNNEPQIQDFVALYAMISRMRVWCAPRTVACAEKVIEATTNAYFAPNRTIADVHALIRSGKGIDPLKEFSEAAREELQQFSYR